MLLEGGKNIYLHYCSCFSVGFESKELFHVAEGTKSMESKIICHQISFASDIVFTSLLRHDDQLINLQREMLF